MTDFKKNNPDDTKLKTERRENWSNEAEFLLSCLGYAVGLGNVWRFPYLCFKNGGGAFLIPYVIMLAVCGLPIFFLELSLGQYCGVGPAVLFYRLAPLFHGVGVGMVVISFLVCVYYNVIMTWTFYYTFSSFSNELGWAKCGHSWNTKDCFSISENDKCAEINMTFWDNSCYSSENFCNAFANMSYLNETHCLNETMSANNTAVPLRLVSKRILPSEEFYLYNVLQASPGIEEFGSLQYHLVVCLFASWFVVGLCLVKGIKSTGKVVYFTALFPYVVLFILLIRGATLEGAADGIYFYIVPTWDKLREATVWKDAAVQIFFSLGPAFGALLTMASYNKFNNNCYRDALFVAIANCCTSVFAGFVIFSILGFMAHSLGVPVAEAVHSGEGLAFIAYPEAVTKMPLSQLWSILFFLMIITLGLDSQFSMCETVITAVQDQRPSLSHYKPLIVIFTCVIMFLLGLPLCAQGGIYLFTLMDTYSAGWSVLVLAFCEFALMSWLYGIKRFSLNIKEMLGKEPNWYWKICWTVISPAVIIGILAFMFITYKPIKYGNYKYPQWAEVLGWLLSFASVICVPAFAIYHLCKTILNKKPLKSLLEPTEEWGPSADVRKSLDNVHVQQIKTGEENEAFTHM